MYIVCRDGEFDHMGYLLYSYAIYRNVNDAIARAEELNNLSEKRYKFGGERFKVYELVEVEGGEKHEL